MDINQFLIILGGVTGWVAFGITKLQLDSVRHELRDLRHKINDLEYEKSLWSAQLQKLHNKIELLANKE